VSGARAIAQRYARALLEVAGPDALKVRDELRAFVTLAEGHREVHRVLVDPALGTVPRRRVLAAVAEQAGVSPLVRRLLDLVATRHRFSLLPDLCEVYAELANQAHGVVSAEVVSAVPLAEPQRQCLAGALGGRVELQCREDPALVGGLLVRVDGTTYDGSVRTRLAALRRRLASPSAGTPAGAS
jgi:F-type H+-transporting ATPase subunit delta